MNQEKQKAYLDDLNRKLKKALVRADASYQRLPLLPQTIDELSDSDLGAYEEFVSRFGRLVDLFLMKFLRAKIQFDDPGFSGVFRDTLDYAEKRGWIDDAAKWFDIRELRNKQVHEYEEEDLIGIFNKTLLAYERVKKIGPLTDAPK